MFGKRTRRLERQSGENSAIIRGLQKQLHEGLNSHTELPRVRSLIDTLWEFPFLVPCAECGCAVIEKDAFRAPGVVKTRPEAINRIPQRNEEYIHHDYFCKKCKPKESK